MPDISIVMAYHNRRKLLYNTLKSIASQNYLSTLEIIIVNDASEISQSIDDFALTFNKLNIKVINISKGAKFWCNPCVPMNIGIKVSSGKVVILQNPECYHVGEIISDIENRIAANIYLVYGCYAIDAHKTARISHDSIESILAVKSTLHVSKEFSANKWYQHSKYNPACLNFCSVINRKDLIGLKGFNEAYAQGIAKDDREFLYRLKRKGLKIVQIDTPFVVHQWHNPVFYEPTLVALNNKLYNDLLVNFSYKIKSRL